MTQVIFDLVMEIYFKACCFTTQKRKDKKSPRKCTAIFVRRQNHNGEVVDSRSWLASGDRFCNSFTNRYSLSNIVLQVLLYLS